MGIAGGHLLLTTGDDRWEALVQALAGNGKGDLLPSLPSDEEREALLGNTPLVAVVDGASLLDAVELTSFLPPGESPQKRLLFTASPEEDRYLLSLRSGLGLADLGRVLGKSLALWLEKGGGPPHQPVARIVPGLSAPPPPSSRGGAEALANLQAIRISQKAYHAEFDKFVHPLGPAPEGPPGSLRPWEGEGARSFNQVGWMPEGLLACRYEVKEATSPMGPGFLAIARCDADGDGREERYEASDFEGARRVDSP